MAGVRLYLIQGLVEVAVVAPCRRRRKRVVAIWSCRQAPAVL